MNDLNWETSNVSQYTESALYGSLYQSIMSPIIELGAEYAEIAIDNIIENEVLKSLPIVNTFAQIGKTVITVRDLFCLKKTICFIMEINNGTINQEKLNKHKDLLEKNPRRLKQEMESILIYLDRENETAKATTLARFYKLYMSDANFNWQDFKTFAEILEAISLYDLETLKQCVIQKTITSKQVVNTLSLSRLSSLGLIEYFGGIPVQVEGSSNVIAKISKMGRFFFRYGFKDHVLGEKNGYC